MRKFVCVLVCLFAMAGLAIADTATVTLSVTNGQTVSYSSPIVASGWLDKIEVVASDGTDHTSTVVVATYSGTTALETYANLATWSEASKVIRPRVLPTANTGAALAAVTANVAGSNDAGTNSTNTVATTILSVPYEMPLIGGNLKMAVTGTANTGTNTVTATIYYIPTKK
jgi:hypothetical protein